MNLIEVKNSIKQFGIKKVNYAQEYIKLDEDLKKQLSAGMVGTKVAENTLQDLKQTVSKYSQETYNKISDELERFYDEEVAARKAKEENVTADDVAELNLIAGMKNTADEMNEYLEKYQNKPIAVKKLLEIAGDTYPPIIVDEKFLNKNYAIDEVYNKLKRKAGYYHYNISANGDKVQAVQADMVVSGGNSDLDAVVAAYLDNE